MARTNELLYALNAGGVDREALSRIDLEKMRLAGAHPVANWLPSVLGPMSLRPGTESMERISGDAVTRMIPFVRSSSTANILAVSASTITIRDGNGVALAVENSASAIANADFSGALSASFATGWKNDSETGGGTAPSVTPAAPGLDLVATISRYASVQQQVAIAGGDQAKRHTVSIVVTRGPVFVRLGTTQDGEELQAETRIGTGTHKLTVTPNASSLWIKIRSDAEVSRRVESCTLEHTVLGGAGALTLPSPWTGTDLYDLAWDQSIDVLFVGHQTVRPYRIERRGAYSWSIAEYVERNGPLIGPVSTSVTLQPSVYRGNGTLTASIGFFRDEHLGALFELTHHQQAVAAELSGTDRATDYVEVNGIYEATIAPNERNMSYVITVPTAFSGTWVLERSVDADAAVWVQVATGTGADSATINDRLSNLRARYRVRITAYVSGGISVSLTFAGGSRTGLVRITGITDPNLATMEVVKTLFWIGPTKSWREPVWTSANGFPQVPRLFDGRLWWFRGDRAYGSVVDDFDNYDDTIEGDSGPIFRSIGTGAAEGARWALDMQRLLVGTTGFEASIRSSSFDEPLTPTAFTVRNASTLGVSRVPAVKVDRGAFFVQRTGRRLYEMLFSPESGDYISQDATRLIPSALAAGVKAMAVQRQPDTRLYLVLEDGSCVVLTAERDDKVMAFTTLALIQATIEDVCVLPGSSQDRVFFVVKRNTTQRYIERLAEEGAQKSTATCALLDGHKVLTGSVSSISGATQFASQTVSVWADGAARPAVAVDGSGNASLGATYSRVVYGRSFVAAFTSVKLAYAARLGTAVGQTKQVRRVAPILANSVVDGLRIGMDAANTIQLPSFYKGAARTSGQFFAEYDDDSFAVPGKWDSDSRIYLEADSAYGPVTVSALVLDVETRDGAQERNAQTSIE